MSLSNVEIENLIDKTMQGCEESFRILEGTYEEVIRGAIWPKARDNDDADDIYQKFWVVALNEKGKKGKAKGKVPLERWDKVRKFENFLRFWARIVLCRYYQEQGDHVHLQLLISDLRRSYPDIESDDDLLDLLRDNPHPEEEPPDFTLEEAEESLSIFSDLLWITFNLDSAPHQLIVFAYKTLLEYEPNKIIEEKSNSRLVDLLEEFIFNYCEDSLLSKDVIDKTFERLRERTKSLGGMTLWDCLKDMKNPSARISEWTGRVKKRVFRQWVDKKGDTPVFLL